MDISFMFLFCNVILDLQLFFIQSGPLPLQTQMEMRSHDYYGHWFEPWVARNFQTVKAQSRGSGQCGRSKEDNGAVRE
jgi:hypothetical protein